MRNYHTLCIHTAPKQRPANARQGPADPRQGPADPRQGPTDPRQEPGFTLHAATGMGLSAVESDQVLI